MRALWNLAVGEVFEVNGIKYEVVRSDDPCTCDLGKDHNCKQVAHPMCVNWTRNDGNNVKFQRVKDE